MTATPISGDGELVTRALGGESAAFGDLYNRYFPPVYDFLCRTVRNADVAAEVTQDTFLRAMQSLSSLAKPAAFKSWLFSIAHSQALNRLQRQRRFLPSSPSPGADDAASDPLLRQVDAGRLADPEQALEMQETARLVWEAATSLDRRTYAVLDLHVRQGLESAEIAEMLGVSKGNGFTILARVKRSVEEAIGAYLLMRQGAANCPTLQQIVAPFAVPPVTPDMLRTVERHVEGCAVCERTRRSLLAPLAVFGAFAAVAPPAGLKERIWKNLEGQWAQPGPRSLGKAGLGKGLSTLTRKVETAGRGSGQAIGGRNLVLVLGAVLLVALMPVIAVFALSIPNSNSPSIQSGLVTATKRPPTATRPPTVPASVTATKAATASSTAESPTLTPVSAATPHPRATTATTAPTAKPAATPTQPPPTATSGHTLRPSPTIRQRNTPQGTPPPLTP